MTCDSGLWFPGRTGDRTLFWDSEYVSDAEHQALFFTYGNNVEPAATLLASDWNGRVQQDQEFADALAKGLKAAAASFGDAAENFGRASENWRGLSGHWIDAFQEFARAIGKSMDYIPSNSAPDAAAASNTAVDNIDSLKTRSDALIARAPGAWERYVAANSELEAANASVNAWERTTNNPGVQADPLDLSNAKQNLSYARRRRGDAARAFMRAEESVVADDQEFIRIREEEDEALLAAGNALEAATPPGADVNDPTNPYYGIDRSTVALVAKWLDGDTLPDLDPLLNLVGLTEEDIAAIKKIEEDPHAAADDFEERIKLAILEGDEDLIRQLSEEMIRRTHGLDPDVLEQLLVFAPNLEAALLLLGGGPVNETTARLFQHSYEVLLTGPNAPDSLAIHALNGDGIVLAIEENFKEFLEHPDGFDAFFAGATTFAGHKGTPVGAAISEVLATHLEENPEDLVKAYLLSEAGVGGASVALQEIYRFVDSGALEQTRVDKVLELDDEGAHRSRVTGTADPVIQQYLDNLGEMAIDKAQKTAKDAAVGFVPYGPQIEKVATFLLDVDTDTTEADLGNEEAADKARRTEAIRAYAIASEEANGEYGTLTDVAAIAGDAANTDEAFERIVEAAMEGDPDAANFVRYVQEHMGASEQPADAAVDGQ